MKGVCTQCMLGNWLENISNYVLSPTHAAVLHTWRWSGERVSDSLQGEDTLTSLSFLKVRTKATRCFMWHFNDFSHILQIQVLCFLLKAYFAQWCCGDVNKVLVKGTLHVWKLQQMTVDCYIGHAFYLCCNCHFAFSIIYCQNVVS